ncbi:hypothetical protein [Acidithiobacillus sulfuriphilus]|uniref:Uncharacterized protein n=2 Tax=Acidithiobacillus sulfuriphilus TaxID=1867749 RepID=A0ACD5HST9_9PROT
MFLLLFTLLWSIFILCLTLCPQGDVSLPNLSQEDLALLVGSLFLAAFCAARSRLTPRREAYFIHAIVHMHPSSAEDLLSRRDLRLGLRLFLGIAQKPFATPNDMLVVAELRRFQHMARALKRQPAVQERLHTGLDALDKSQPASHHRAALMELFHMIASQLGEPYPTEEASTLACFFGLRMAWWWQSLGMGRLPLSCGRGRICLTANRILRHQ